MNLLTRLISNTNALIGKTKSLEEPQYSSRLDYNAAQVACNFMLGDEGCRWVQKYQPGWMNIVKLFSPDLVEIHNGQYAFRWSGNEFSLNCAEGQCGVFQLIPKPQEEISLAEIVGGILSGPTGCTVDEPRSFSLPVISFPERLSFCLNKDNIFENYSDSYDCLKKKDVSIADISTCVFLDAVYTVSETRDVKLLPEATNASNFNIFLRNTLNKGFRVKFSGNNVMPHGPSMATSLPMAAENGKYIPESIQKLNVQVWNANSVNTFGPIMLFAHNTTNQIYVWLYDDLHKCSLLYDSLSK